MGTKEFVPLKLKIAITHAIIAPNSTGYTTGVFCTKEIKCLLCHLMLLFLLLK